MREQFLMCANQASWTSCPSCLWSNNRNKVSQNSLKQLWQLNSHIVWYVYAATTFIHLTFLAKRDSTWNWDISEPREIPVNISLSFPKHLTTLERRCSICQISVYFLRFSSFFHSISSLDNDLSLPFLGLWSLCLWIWPAISFYR